MLKLLSVIVLFSFSQLTLADDNSNDGTALTFDYIHDYLAPFGKWYETDDYGFVWRPFAMRKDWQPFTEGKWQLTDQGWLWISNFDWGWLTFHYGNWVRHKIIGWCWVPGYDWSPAQVTWYWTENFVGWAPIPPVNPGESYEIAPEDWFFVSIADFLSPYLYNYQVLYSVVSPEVCIPYETSCNYYFYNCCFCCWDTRDEIWVGPPCLIIEKNVKRKLKKKKVITLKKPNPRGKKRKKNVVEVYKPTIRKINKADTKIATVSKAGKSVKSKNNKQKKYKHVLSDHRLPITPIKSKDKQTPQPTVKPPVPKPIPTPDISPPTSVKPAPLVAPPVLKSQPPPTRKITLPPPSSPPPAPSKSNILTPPATLQQNNLKSNLR